MSRPPERPLDIRQLFRQLAANHVDYIVVGGVAAQVHGRRRTTKDLDIILAPGRANTKRLAQALCELEARPTHQAGGADIPAPRADQLEQAPIVPPLTTTHGELHVLREVPGAAPYPALCTRALRIELDGISVLVVSVDDLIRMKQATGRPRDLEDIAAILEVARRERGLPDR